MNHTITNGILTAEISSLGAELQSLKTTEGREYMYDGSSVWKERAPQLFPIVGCLRDGKYDYKGSSFEMKIHGFARRCEFEFLGGDSSGEKAVFLLRESPETLEQYPFAFEFYVVYELDGGKLSVTYLIKNTNPGEMYFSVGAHEGYRCPLDPGESFTDYKLIFGETETADRCDIVPGGLRGAGTTPFLVNTDTVDLTYDFFITDAVVLLWQKSQSLKLESKKSGHGVEVEFPGFPMLGIWTRPDAPYLCIEPWHGVCDRDDHDYDFTKKDGIIRLDSQKTFSCTHTIRPY